MGPVAALVVAAVAVITAWSTIPTSVSPADAAPQEFSSERAMIDLERFAAEPRLPGTPAHNEARELLLSKLDRLGWDTEVHTSVGANADGGDTIPLAVVTNIVATLPGTDPTGTILVAAHYDSVAASPGAADDGIGVATALETARALAGDARPRNNVTLLITDAEEPGLLGAEAFVHDHAKDLGPAVVVNLEARGNRGRPVSLRLTQPNSVLLDMLAETPRPVVDSFSDALFTLLPNNTDLVRFTGGGLYGYDTAITGGGAYYHTPLDDPARLSEASLQQMGEGTLAFVRIAGAEDLTRIAEGDRELAVSHPWGFLRHPQGWELPLAIGTLMIALAVAAVARARRQISLPRTAFAAVVALLAPPLTALAAMGVWGAALAVDPGQASAFVGEPYVAWPYRLACIAAVVGVVALFRVLLRRVLPGPTFATGALIMLAVLGVALAVPSSGFSSPAVLSTLPAAVAALIAQVLGQQRPVARTLVQVVGVFPAALFLGPGALDSFDIGVGEGGPLAALFIAVLVLLTLGPVDAPAPAPTATRKDAGLVRVLRSPLVLLLVVALGLGTGLLLNREGATDPRQEMISYSLDADSGNAVWSSWSPSGSAWSRDLMDDPVSSLEQLPWLGGGDLANGAAPNARLVGPKVQVISDRTVDDQREITVDLASPRGAQGIGMWFAAEAQVQGATVAGREVPMWARTSENDSRPFGFLLQGSEEPIRVRLLLGSTEGPVRAEVADLTHDVGVVPEFTPPPEGRMLIIPNVYVHRTVQL